MYRIHVQRLIPPLVLGLALLAWLALPIAAELRPEMEWDLPLGNVLNADPEPPWTMILHAGEATALLQTPLSDHVVLLPEPASTGSEVVLVKTLSPPGTPARSSPLLILHQRRNE